MDQEESQDPLRSRALQNAKFRDDDPPEVRRAILEEYERRERAEAQDAIDPKIVT